MSWSWIWKYDWDNMLVTRWLQMWFSNILIVLLKRGGTLVIHCISSIHTQFWYNTFVTLSMKFQHMESRLSITLLSIDPLPLSHQSLCRNFQLEFWDFYRDPSKEIEIMHNTHLYIFVTNLPILRRRFFNNIDCGLSMKRIPLAHE